MTISLRRPISPIFATAADAVRYLASACDGAMCRDGHSFRSDHVNLGHYLAQTSDADWNPWCDQQARHLSRIYRCQLDAAGFNTAHIIAGRSPLFPSNPPTPRRPRGAGPNRAVGPPLAQRHPLDPPHPTHPRNDAIDELLKAS